MGNQQSDLGEQEAWKVIGHVPVVNFFYGGIRAAVYASKNNIAEAHSGALGMIPFAHNVIPRGDSCGYQESDRASRAHSQAEGRGAATKVSDGGHDLGHL